MVRPDSAPLKVTVEFVYEADIFEDDPVDVYELAKLELPEVQGMLEDAIQHSVGRIREYKVKVIPE